MIVLCVLTVIVKFVITVMVQFGSFLFCRRGRIR